MRALNRREKIRTQSRRAGLHPIYGRFHSAERSAEERLDGSVRRNRWTDAWLNRRVGVQRHRRAVRHSDFFCARLVWLFSESVQSHSGRHVGRWANRDCPFALALAAGIRGAALVRLEISELYRLADGHRIFPACRFTVSQTDLRRPPLLRSARAQA